MRELERAKDELKKTIEFEAERDNPDSPENAEDEDPVKKDSNKPEDLGNIPTTRI